MVSRVDPTFDPPGQLTLTAQRAAAAALEEAGIDARLDIAEHGMWIEPFG